MKNEKILLFLVDDDVLFLKSLELDFHSHANFDIETYPTGELCIENLSHKPDVIILDYFLSSIDKNALNGVETLDVIKVLNPNIPIVLLSGQSTIEKAILSMNEKPFNHFVVKGDNTFMRLQKIISSFFLYNTIKKLIWYDDK